MSNSIQVFLEMQGIDMLEGDVWGHRKDLDEYFTVDDATLAKIRSLAASGVSAEEVADQIQRKARIGPELIKYIAKTKITAKTGRPGQTKLLACFFMLLERMIAHEAALCMRRKPVLRHEVLIFRGAY